MTEFSGHAAQYIATRRALGYRLAGHGRLLEDLVRQLSNKHTTRLTIDIALEWASRGSSDAVVANRLSVARSFARYMKAFDDGTEVPPRDMVRSGLQRVSPYLYSPREIARLMEACRRLDDPLTAATFEGVVGLMAATGMRTGEVLRLERSDADLDSDMLLVRMSKFDKTRLLPVHPTTTAALRTYAARRDELCADPKAANFFLSAGGGRFAVERSGVNFGTLTAWAEIVAPPSQRPPRLYDLRHTFAVNTLISWYAQGVNVNQRLPVLSTYMGHIRPENTYWYLEAAPELMALAAERLESFVGVLS